MPISQRPSGLLVVTHDATERGPKFKCRYELDERVNRDLANLCQKLYRDINGYLGERVNVRVVQHQGAVLEAIPDPVQAWVLYIAALIQGAADAALTLAVHNLGREAKIIVRQIFEYAFKAQYFASHRHEAKRELETEAFREVWMLDDLGYDRRRARYRNAVRESNALRRRRPVLYAYAKRTRYRESTSVPKTMGRRGKRRATTYALHYRVPSQTLHAGILGMRDVFREEGINFDSREPDPNYTILVLCRYLVLFLRLLNHVFDLGKKTEIDRDVRDLKVLDRTLQPHLNCQDVCC